MNDNNHIDKLNVLFSLDFPVTEEQVELFLKSDIDYTLRTDPSRINAKRILEEVRNEGFKPSGKDYHKRTVLAAEIVFQLHNEWTLGHVKLQKLIYLCQNTMGMALHTNFLKQAMGPYDPILMRSIDSQFEKHKWFKFNREAQQKYLPLENVGEHHKWYVIYFSEELSDINQLISIFKKASTDQVELIATLYASWKELLDESKSFDETLLSQRFFNWSKEKEKFKPNQISQAIKWMIEKGIHPS
jgi:uncharacterized protein YwgA